MDLGDWKNFLWRVVRSEFCKPSGKVYLCFNDTTLQTVADRIGFPMQGNSPTDALNDAIAQHTVQLSTGRVVLSVTQTEVDDDWHWALTAGSDGRSFALVFAAQQILAAERMEGQSYYEAYWQMLGYEADELRSNPFADGGRFSFKMLWGTLKKELCQTLKLDDAQITFRYGHGTNKFRNLPISQALLNVRDLNAIMHAVGDPNRYRAETVIPALRRVHLSNSGRKKVFNDAVAAAVAEQYRDYWAHRVTGEKIEPRSERPTGQATEKLSAQGFFLTEHQELLDDPFLICGLSDGDEDVDRELDRYFSENAVMVFRSDDADIVGSDQKTLLDPGEEVWLMCLPQTFREFSEDLARIREFLKLETCFISQSSEIPNGLCVYYCRSVPDEYCGTNFASPTVSFRPQGSKNLPSVSLFGGVCVNEVSRSYLLGYTPNRVVVDGSFCEADEVCQLNGVDLRVGEAIRELRARTTPSPHLLRVRGKEIVFETVVKRAVELQTGYILTDWSVYSRRCSGLVRERLRQRIQPLDELVEDLDQKWLSNRARLTATLRNSLVDPSHPWIRVSLGLAEQFSTLSGQLFDRQSLSEMFAERVRRTKTMPWAAYEYFRRNRLRSSAGSDL